jgi:hypothetical protein
MKHDYDIGRHYYKSGRPFDDCETEEKRDGWQDAAADAFEAGLKAEESCMMSAQLAGECIGWGAYWQAIDKMAERELRHATG